MSGPATPPRAGGASAPRPLRLAFVTIGQAPREDVVPELLALLELGPDAAACDQFGALDGLSPAELAARPPGARERRLHTRLADGTDTVVGAGLVAPRLSALLHRLDAGGYDLLVLISTGVFQPFRLRTPFVHGQQAVDAWIEALVMGECELGMLYPLPRQHRAFAHGVLIQNTRTVAATGESARLEDAAGQLARAQIILMHSVGYTEAMARRLAEATRRPVVTARRIIAGAVRLHLAGHAGRRRAGTAGLPLIDRLPEADELTARERDVLAAVLEGETNKAVGQRLGISHRTVEIHRGRAMAKLNAASPTELMRRVLIMGGG